MTNCKICESTDTILLDRRASVPIAQNLILPTAEQARHCPAGELDMRRCTACGFVWNAAFDPQLMVYDATYDNDQNFSPRFQQHTAEVAARIGARVGAQGAIRLVEVGCGQGAFMAVMGERFGERLVSAIGFDPAWQGDPRHLPPGGEVRGAYFGDRSIRGCDPVPNLVVSRHVIEHVPDPVTFLRAIRAGVPEGTPVFIETPDIDWVLRGGVFFDFYYEHCSLFAQSTLALALERTGFVVDDVTAIFDDQYQLAMATAGPTEPVAFATPVPGTFDDLGFRAKSTAYLQGLAATIDGLGPRGSCALWGGASKGVTICLTLPDASSLLPCVIDINTRKQDCYLPTSAIPILSPEAAVVAGIRHAIVINPAYLGEIRQCVAAQGLPLTIHPIAESRTV